MPVAGLLLIKDELGGIGMADFSIAKQSLRRFCTFIKNDIVLPVEQIKSGVYRFFNRHFSLILTSSQNHQHILQEASLFTSKSKLF